jgi:NAD(P)-dependent dehydrogenase (short-subunit alcohol dehydrogenase family)
VPFDPPAGIEFHDVNFERHPYDAWIAYGQSKTANSLFAVAVSSIGQRQGVRAFAVYPGSIVTGLMLRMSQGEIDASNVFDESGNPTSIWRT